MGRKKSSTKAIELLAVNDPHESIGNGGSKATSPKSYGLVRITKHNGKVEEVLMPMTLLLDIKSMKAFFINNGHAQLDDDKYWLRVRDELRNYPDVQLKLSYSPGYVGGVYLCSNGLVIGDQNQFVRLHPDANFRPSSTASSGTLKEWKENVASLALYSDRMLLALCVSFSGLIMKWANQESGGFHLHAESSVGKTTATLLASTVFGGPEYLCSWDITEAGVEEVAVGRNDALLPLNELKLLSSDPVLASQKASKLIYMIAEGKGKHRARSYQCNVNTWATVVLSSGELSLAEHAESGKMKRLNGECVRVIDLHADSQSGFGILDRLPEEFPLASGFSEHIQEQSQVYYGSALLPYVEGLLTWENGKPGSVKRRIVKHSNRFIKKCGVDKTKGQEMRVIRRFAVAYAAGAIAIELGVLDFSNSQIGQAIKKCYEAYVREKPESQSEKIDRAYQRVLDKLANAKLLKVRKGTGKHSLQDLEETEGFAIKVKGLKMIAIEREVLLQWIGNKVQLIDVISKFEQDKRLLLNSDGKRTRQVRTGVLQRPRVRCFCFRSV